MSAPDPVVRRDAAIDDRTFARDFPILATRVHGKRLVYLDSAATTQKPQVVIDAVRHHYESECANVHRGLYELSAKATEAFEASRRTIAALIGASGPDEVVFTSGTTAAINTVAHSWGERAIAAGDEIVVTRMEHHSNIVPWQLLCLRSGARLRVVPIHDDGTLDLDAYERLLGPRTRLVAVAHTSNALGTRNPVRRIADAAHAVGARVLVDAAQALAHEPVDVAALGCDFLAFSGHKMFGPTGIGVLWGRRELLDEMPPFLGGGEMIETVRFEGSTFKAPPHRFEAGTPPIAAAIGLGAAARWLVAAGIDRIAAHDRSLLDYARARLEGVPRLRFLGTAPDKAPIVSFHVDGIHAHDVAQWLDDAGVAVRAGHHCAQPLMERFGVTSTVRASFACYNSRDDVDVLVAALARTIEVFR